MRKMNGRARALALAGAMAAILLASMARAGNLDPAAPPAPTMKTLDEIPPTWSQLLPAAERFELVLAFSTGVLDKETGLVWQRQPSSISNPYSVALGNCFLANTGDRHGWRLPRIEELLSLIDPTVPEGQARLPTGHPFILPPSGTYWTMTSTDGGASSGGSAHAVDPFSTSFIVSGVKGGVNNHFAWCVRGGSGYNGSES